MLRMMDLVDTYNILSLLLSMTDVLRQSGDTLFGPMELFGRVLASPKSQILIWQYLFMRMFPGLRSLWTILADARKLRAQRRL